MTIWHITIVLLLVWLAAMAWMKREQKTPREPSARWIQTAQGGLWVACTDIPNEGQQVRAWGHWGAVDEYYQTALAMRGTLSLVDGDYHWESSHLPRYA